jgi:hypothetical protein
LVWRQDDRWVVGGVSRAQKAVWGVVKSVVVWVLDV